MTTQSRSRALGKLGERLVRTRLRAIGLKRIQKIETGWRIHRDARGKIVNATPIEKVQGDFTAIAPDGRSVLVEAKWREEDRLRYSDLKPHQREALDEQVKCNGIGLVAWAHPDGAMILLWPCLEKGKALRIEEAKQMQLKRLFNRGRG